MKRVIAVELILVLLLVGVMSILLYQKNPRADVTAAEISAMVESMADPSVLTSAGTLRLRRSFGLDATNYDLAVYYMPTSSMNVEEFLLIRGDESTLSSVQSAMEERIADQISIFEHYGEKQTELLNKAVIRRFGNYICLIVAEDPDVWLNAVKSLLEV